jgi:hypothetical protein
MADHARWLAGLPPTPIPVIHADAAGRARERERFRATAWSLLGDFPPHLAAPCTTWGGDESRDGLIHQRFTFDDGCGWSVPGVLWRPDGPGPFPAVLWCHWHGGDYRLGTEAIDRACYTPEAPGPALARRGYVVLGIDAPGFGQRNGCGPDGTDGGIGEASIVKHGLLTGRTMWGLTLHDDLLALAVLASRPEVDAARIGVAGISMGCLRSLWLAALDERVRATIAICCLTRNQDLIAAGGLQYHSHYYYVPGMLRHFDIESVMTAIAPRALLALNGELDPLTPLMGIRMAEHLARPAWSADGVDDRLRVDIETGVGHAWTPAMWRESMAFLDQHLA